MIMTALDGGARGSRRAFGQRLARLAGCAAVAMVGVALAAAPALGDKIDVVANVTPLNVNFGQHVPPYKLQAQLDTSGDGVHTLTITNPSSNASVGTGRGILTGAELDGPGGATFVSHPECCMPESKLQSNDPFTFPFDGPVDVEPANGFRICGSQDFDVMICTFAGEGNGGEAENGIRPGESVTIRYTTTAGIPGLYRLEEHFDFNDQAPRCRPSGYGTEVRHRGAFPFGAMAASSCTVPASPKIDEVLINQKKHTARFHQKAKRATSFACELIRNNKLRFVHSCGPRKRYSNPLKPGKYVYLVWAVNSAGRSKRAGFQGFTIK